MSGEVTGQKSETVMQQYTENEQERKRIEAERKEQEERERKERERREREGKDAQQG